MKVKILLSWLATVCVCFAFKVPVFQRIEVCIAPAVVASLFLAGTVLSAEAQPASIISGKELFDKSCSGCHSGGGNLFGGKTLKKDALLSNKVFEPSKMAELILRGKGLMPAYGEFISPMGNTMPAKFTNEETSAVVDYIIQQADLNWKVE